MNTFTRLFRKIALTALVSIPVAGLFAQAPVVPDPVKAAFSKSNPGISPVWAVAGKGYEARFSKEGQKLVYIYDAAGSLQIKKIVTPEPSLPSIVTNTLVQTYAGSGVVKEAYKVSTRSNEKYYEVVLETATTQERLKLNETGTILNKASRPLAQASPAATANPAMASASKPASATPAPATKPAPTATAATSPAATTSSQMSRPSPEDDLEYVDDEELESFDDLDSLFPGVAATADEGPLNDNFLFEDEADTDPYSDLASDDDR